MTSSFPVTIATAHLAAAHAAATPAAARALEAHWVLPLLGQVRSRGLAVSGELLAAAGGSVCCVWNTATHERVARFVEPGSIQAIAAHGGHVAIAAGKRVRLYRIAEAEVALEYAHAALVTSVHIGQSGLIASADGQGVIELHQIDEPSSKARHRHEPGDLTVFAESTGALVVSQSERETAFIDAHSGAVQRRFRVCAAPAASPSPIARGPVLIVPSGSELRLFDCACSGAECFRLIELDSTVTSVDAPDGAGFFLASTLSGRIHVFDLNSGVRLDTVRSFTNPLFAAAFGPRRRLFAAAGEGLIAQIEHRRNVYAYTEAPPLVCAALSPDGNVLLLGDRCGGVARHDLRDGARSMHSPGHAGSVNAIACDDENVATVSYDGTCRVTHRDGGPSVAFDLGVGPVQAVALDRTRRAVWAGGYRGAVFCHELDTLRCCAAISDGADPIRSLALSAGGRLLLVGNNQGELLVRELGAGDRVVERYRLANAAYRSMFDAGGDILATSARGISRFRIGNARPIAEFDAPRIRDFCLLGDGLASLSLDGELRVFDAGGCLRACARIDDPRPHRAILALSPERLLTASGDATVRVFRLDGCALTQVATLYHLARDVLWTTVAEGAHPGWFHATDASLLAIGESRDGERTAWQAADPRRDAHRALFESASHVMEVVTGRVRPVPSANPDTALPSLRTMPLRLGYTRCG